MDIKLNDYKKVLAMDARTLKNLSDKDFKNALRAVTTEAKRRKTRLKNAKSLDGTTSPAYRKYERNEWSMPKDKNKAIIQIQQAKSFINDKTSSVKGYQEHQNKILKSFNKTLGTNLSKKKFARLTGVLDELSKNDLTKGWYSMEKQYDSERQMTSIIEIVDMFKNKSDDEIIQILIDKHKYDYERSQFERSTNATPPEVPESLKEIYPKEYAEYIKYNEKDDSRPFADDIKETIFK